MKRCAGHVVIENEAAAARSAALGLDDGERRLDGEGGVGGVAASEEDLSSGLAGEGMSAGDDVPPRG